MRPGWTPTGSRVAAFGPALTMPYDAALRRDLRTILDLAPTLSPTMIRVCASVAERLTDYHVRAVEGAGPPGRPDRLSRADHPASAAAAPDLADRRCRRCWRADSAFRWRTISARPTSRRAGRGRRWRRSITPRLAATLPKPLAVLNIGGVANVTWIGRDGRLAGASTPAGQRSAGRLGVPAHRRRRSTRTARSPAPDELDQAVLASADGRSVFRPAGAEIAGSPGFRGGAGGERAVRAFGRPTARRRLAQFTVASIAAATFPGTARRAGWSAAAGGTIRR